MSPGIEISIMSQLLSFLFTTTISSFLALISLSHCIITSHKSFTSSFSTTSYGASSYHFSFLCRLYFPHNFQLQLFLQHYCAFSCTPFVPTFHINSQYEILFHFSCNTFYKVLIGLFYLSPVSHGLLELLFLEQHTTWLLFQLSSQLFRAITKFLFYLLLLAFLLQTFLCFSIVPSFPSPSLFEFLLIRCIITFYCFHPYTSLTTYQSTSSHFPAII